MSDHPLHRNAVATSGGDLMETEVDIPPASAYKEPSNYYASLRNPDGSLYQSLDDVPKSSGLSIPRASAYASLNGHQEVYNPLTSKDIDQSLYDVPNSIPRASAYAILNGHQEVYYPLNYKDHGDFDL